MSTVTFEIPEAYARSFGSTEDAVRHNAKIELAIAMYRDARWSTGRAAEFADMALIEFMELLRNRKIEKPYTIEMVEQDFAYAGSGQ
jgi:predicted HTH domain antitoxin